MKRLIIPFLLLLSGCSDDDALSKETLNNYLKTSFDETGFKDYIEGEISINLDDEETTETSIRYLYSVDTNLKDDFFNNLTMEEEYNLIIALSDEYEDEFTCGDQSICTIEKFTFLYNEDIYEVTPRNNDLKLITINGDIYGLDDVRPQEKEEIQEATITEDNPSMDSNAVYAFMKQVYEEITDYGANYVPEVHDQQVAEMASEKFGITVEEAGQIYINIEMSGGI